MHAIVLAAGDATRLPNKPLLTTRSGKPLIQSSIDFAKQFTNDISVVLRSPETPAARYVDKYNTNCRQVYQTRPSGVVDAIRIGINDDLDSLILFADCFYSNGWPEPHKNHASVSRCGHDELDGWSGENWVDRACRPQLKFCGWIRTDRDITQHDMLLQNMNAAGIRPYAVEEPIHDLGTPDAYRGHWNSGLHS